MSGVVVGFVTRTGCTLCAQAQPIVERLASLAGARVELLDVDTDPALAHWSDHVPVVLLDGILHSRWWVQEDELRTALGLPL